MLYVALNPKDILSHKNLGLEPTTLGQVFLSSLDAVEYMAQHEDDTLELYGVDAVLSQTYTFNHQEYYLKYAVRVIELDEFGGIKYAKSA